MNKCEGCGVVLQDVNKEELGYTSNLENTICERCFRLKNYGEYRVVSLNNDDYKEIINTIPKDALIVYVADILSLNLTNIPSFKNTILVLNKYDIMPKSTKEEKIIAKIKNTYPKLLDVMVISCLKNYNIDRLYNMINKYSNKKSVYLIGNTNSGKSTLLNKLIKNYNDEILPNITVSMYPSTTLDKVEVKIKDLTIIDTPGLIDEGSYVNVVSSSDLKKITPKKEIKPRSCQISGKGSMLIGEYVRMDYDSKESNSFVIYTSPMVSSSFTSYNKNTYKELKKHNFNLGSNQDIVIPGLGFIKFTKPIEVIIYVHEKVVPYARDNLV